MTDSGIQIGWITELWKKEFPFQGFRNLCTLVCFFTVILLTNSTLDKTVLDRRFTTKNENKKSDANNFVIV